MRYIFKLKEKTKCVGTNFFIGDIVYIVSTGGSYTSYVNAYSSLGLDFNKRQNLTIHNHNNGAYSFKVNPVYLLPFVVKWFCFHETSNELLVGIENDETCLVIDHYCLRKLVNPFTCDDNKSVLIEIERVNANGKKTKCNFVGSSCGQK